MNLSSVIQKTGFQLNAAGILSAWRTLGSLPGGKTAFSRLIGFFVPYSGKLGATIEEMAPGRVVVSLSDRRSVRNHLSSVHAMALANLGELASGLSLITSLPPEAQAILTGFSITYLKKARGRLTAEGTCDAISSVETRDMELVSSIRNAAKEEVAQVHAWWRIGPRRTK